MKSDHVLVIGGSGCLAGASLHLARQGCHVSVVGRQAERLAALAGEGGPHSIHPVPADYGDSHAFACAIDEAIAACGPIGLAVCWIHGHATEAPRIVAERVQAGGDYFHMLPSAFAAPGADPDYWARVLGRYALTYHRVVTGWVRERHGVRWLTDAEISDGMIHAITQDLAHHVIGTVAPWSDRP